MIEVKIPIVGNDEPTQDGNEEVAEESAEKQPSEAKEEAVEKEADAPEAEVKKEGPKFYTDEEVLEILDRDGKLDRNRLSPAQRLIQKSFEKHYNKVYQEAAEAKREAIKAKEQTEQPKTIEEAYERDPKGVLSWIDSEIIKASDEAEKTGDPFAALKKIGQLQAKRNQLTDMNLEKSSKTMQDKERLDEVLTDIKSEVPDYVEKREALTDFAISELGYSMEEVVSLSDWKKNGTAAAKFVKTINRLFDKANSPQKVAQSVASKQVVKAPIVESAGKNTTTAAEQEQYKKIFKEAQKSGDWTKALQYRGVMRRLTG